MKKITMNNRFSYLALASLTLGLYGCGGTGQDQGTPSGFSQTYSGIAVDGYLARSTVFIDSNNNGTRDSWEAWAFTDNQGYYSFNPTTNTDYCADEASEQESQYCLNSNVEYSNVVIRIDSGYDVLTGEPFLGQMSRRVNALEQGQVTQSIVSPITSLLTDVESESDREDLLTTLNITETDLDIDYLNDVNGSVNAPLLNTALKIHKVVAVLSDRLTDTYDEIGEDFGTPNDASSAIYPNLATQLINANSSLDEALSDENTLLSTLDAAEDSLRSVYERKEFTLPPDMGDTSNPDAFSRVVQVASEFSSVINTLIDVNDQTFTLDDALGTTRALETLVIKTVNENEDRNIDTSIDNVINFFDVEQATQDAKDRVLDLVSNLSLDSADINSLVLNNFNTEDFDTAEEILAAANISDDVKPFTQIGGLQLKVSDLDLGYGPANLDDSEVELYFDGGSTDIDGSFKACVKFIDGANINGTLGDGNTRGELVTGFWSLLGTQSSSSVQSYSLLLTLTFLGTTYQAIMKPSGKQLIHGIEYEAIRFDNNGEFNVWHSKKGFEDVKTIPRSNYDCQERLPSRIGI